MLNIIVGIKSTVIRLKNLKINNSSIKLNENITNENINPHKNDIEPNIILYHTHVKRVIATIKSTVTTLSVFLRYILSVIIYPIDAPINENEVKYIIIKEDKGKALLGSNNHLYLYRLPANASIRIPRIKKEHVEITVKVIFVF